MANLTEIKQFLDGKGIKYNLIDLPEVAVSVDDLVRLTNGNINVDEILKTLIVKIKDNEFVACVLVGKDRLDKKSQAFERLAARDEVKQLTCVDIGAVCPILLDIPVIIDQKVTKLQRVNMGSGDRLHGLEMDLKDLISTLQNYKIYEIAE